MSLEPVAPEHPTPVTAAASPSVPAASSLRRRLIGIGALLATLVVVGAFGVVALLARLPAAHPTARPVAQCPAPPATGQSGPQLYWKPSTAPVQGGSTGLPTVYEAPTLLCGVGFGSGEHITLSLEQRYSDASTPAPVTVTANADGSFATTYRVAPAYQCGTSGTGSRLLQASGDNGSKTVVALPLNPDLECPITVP